MRSVLGGLLAEIGGDDGGGVGLGLGGGGESMEVSYASRGVLEFGDVFSGGVELGSEPRFDLGYSRGVEAAAALRFGWGRRIRCCGDEIAHRTRTAFCVFCFSEGLGEETLDFLLRRFEGSFLSNSIVPVETGERERERYLIKDTR